jgi:hypothetical protein
MNILLTALTTEELLGFSVFSLLLSVINISVGMGLYIVNKEENEKFAKKSLQVMLFTMRILLGISFAYLIAWFTIK